MKLRIYLVEDNATVVELLIALLEEVTLAQVVGSSATESEACEWLQAHQALWDLVVLDLGLAKGTGLGILQCLRAQGAAQKMVVLSNCRVKMARTECLNAGADAFFDKASETAQLIDYVNQCSAA